MALDPRDFIQGAATAEEEPDAAPLAGTRRQRVQRLQLGIAGLGAMLLMVGLANLIISSAQSNQIAPPEELAPVTTQDVPPPAPPRDPLADAGVVPDLPADTPPAAEGQGDGLLPETGDVPPPAVSN